MTNKNLIRFVVVISMSCLVGTDLLGAGRGGDGKGGGARGGSGGGGRAGGGGMAQVGGGGGRPSVGARPAGGGGGANHSIPSRPANAGGRPSMANASRPNTPNISRPGGGDGAAIGNFHPSGGRPSTRPATPQAPPRAGGGNSGVAQRPAVRPGGDLKPATRPGAGDIGFNRPGAGGGGIQRPDNSLPTRPGQGDGGILRPDNSLPGQGGGGIQRPRPNRPSIGDITRPGQGGSGTHWRPDRPRPDHPDVGPDRPGFRPDPPGYRPDRPTIGGGGNNIVNRPIHIGDTNIGNTNIVNTNIGGNTNIGIANRPVVANRPINNWGVRPGGDYWSQNHNWADHWNNNCINNHHNWYHGCWNGHGGNNWYAPVTWGTIGYGVGSVWGNGWGYGQTYSNPYYETVESPVYNYSQPVSITTYVYDQGTTTIDAGTNTTVEAPAAPPQDPPEMTAALKLYDAALASFKFGEYQKALAGIDGALRSLPKDPVLHETRALCLFALGRYREAAATLNSLLASAPGMDWTSMSSLYGDADDYTAQLHTLEAQVRSKPSDAAAIFVLAYHYLVIGQNDLAIKMLEHVVKLQPKDATAQRMLAALAPPKPAQPEPPEPSAPALDGPATDLVGTWAAKGPDATIELEITEDSKFSWRATPKGQPAVELTGNVATSSEELVLESKDQGNMAGKVMSGGPDKFTFAMLGTPPGDPGLEFQRKK